MLLSTAIELIKHQSTNKKTTWADLGCGDGLFTNALSQLLDNNSTIYAVDKNKRSLKNVEVRNNITLEKFELDFVKNTIPFNNLSGILMANSFHFIKDKNAFIQKAFGCLSSDGNLIMVEYDTDKSGFWVPYPISFKNLIKFFADYNCTTTRLNETPSRYHGIIYSAVIRRVI